MAMIMPGRLVAAVALMLFSLAGFAHAQTVTAAPTFVRNQSWVDLGNGPLEIQPVEGNGNAYTSLGTGVGSTSGSSTTLTLTATPAIVPCVGCIISGTGITSGTTVAAYATTTITLSAAMTVAASTALSWGAACPAATAANVVGVSPNTVASLGSPLSLRSGQNNSYVFYTQARVCMTGAQQNGLTALTFPVGAH